VFLFTKIDEGLIHLIKIYGVTELVMGAAANRHYRRSPSLPPPPSLSVLETTMAHNQN